MILQCEGACNPTRSALDLAVLRAQPHDARNRVPLHDPALVQALRALRYTVHQPAGIDHAQCVVCRTTRRSGRTLKAAWGRA